MRVPVGRACTKQPSPKALELGINNLERAPPLGVLAHEPRNAAPVPERPARQPALVGLRLVLVPDDGLRHVPALPPRALRAVLQVDVLPVETKALVETAELVEHRAAVHQEPGEHPVRLDRL